MEGHDGVASTSALLALGFSKRQVDGMVHRGELVRVRRGLYRGRGVRWDLRAELRSALDASGEDARLVLVSALHWQGLLTRPADRPQLGVPGSGNVDHGRDWTVYRTPYAAREPVVHDGLRCSAPVDAIAHLAGRIGGEHAVRRAVRRAVREAVRREHRVLADLQARALQRFPGVGELRDALASVPCATVVRSDLEEDFVAFCEIWGLPRFLMNQKVGGVERDAVRPVEHLIVELDTRGFHGNLVALEADRARRRRATVAGWRHLEVTGRDLSREPARLASDIAALLGLPGWRAPSDASARWADVIDSARGIWLPR